jgi:hypothetical protein
MAPCGVDQISDIRIEGAVPASCELAGVGISRRGEEGYGANGKGELEVSVDVNRRLW